MKKLTTEETSKQNPRAIYRKKNTDKFCKHNVHTVF